MASQPNLARELLDELRAAIQDMRIEVALRRDDQPTEQELIVKLEVYGEFGR
jgi:hypothetical protein